jgi:hypothetical protein
LQQRGEAIAKGSIAATSGDTREPQDKISETAGAIFDPTPLRTHLMNSAVSLAAVIGAMSPPEASSQLIPRIFFIASQCARQSRMRRFCRAELRSAR